MLHGCTQSAEDFAPGTGMNRLADLHGFIAVYAEQPPGASASRCWNWFTGENQVRGRGEPSLIAGLAREVIARDGGDRGWVFIAGMSAGGAMAVIVFHGDGDPTVHPSNGIEIVPRAGRLHAARAAAPILRAVTSRGTSEGGRRHTRTVHQGDGGTAPIEAWTLYGAGHAWSGGQASGSHTDATGPDASAEMVRFFLALQRREDRTAAPERP
ncbi:MAG: PHB depolymerase family esterase [Betaproteobacteria bacterium]|jgi:poly(3-hydroxybutyrate) depolymerase|nr:PHB depolymerase family esterase [Betaproteobacteria bacterium]